MDLSTVATHKISSASMVRSSRLVVHGFEPLHRLGSLGRGQQRRPVGRRVPARQHPGKHGIRVRIGTGLAQSVTVIDPGVYDQPGPRVGPEEQPESIAAEPGPKPVPVRRPHRVALVKLRGQGVAWDAVQYQAVQRHQQAGVGFSPPALRVGSFGPRHR
jgi:hypothetical protein